MLIKFISMVLTGFLLSIFFIAFAKGFILRRKILLSNGMPLAGGAGIVLSFFIVFLFGGHFSKEFIGIFVSSILMFIFGLVDDVKKISIAAKFLTQIIAAAILILFGIKTQIVCIGGFINIIITFVWVLGITNAFNHLDVMDGLAGIAALIISSAFFITSIFNNDIKIAILSLALIGPICGFLKYNFPPAKAYMGNSGSHFLGFILAAMAMAVSYAPMERKAALISPLLILGFPIFDTAFVIYMRMKKGLSVFEKSDDHPALKLLKTGLSKTRALRFMFICCLFFSVSGIAVSQSSNFSGIAIIFTAAAVSLMLTVRLSRIN